jgi:hypothetical protein
MVYFGIVFFFDIETKKWLLSKSKNQTKNKHPKDGISKLHEKKRLMSKLFFSSLPSTTTKPGV